MNIIQRDIFVTRKDITVVIPYPQGGNAVPIYLRIADWQIPYGSTARIYMRKPSGAEIYNDCVINGNIVQITVTTQMTAEAGWVKSTLEIVNGTDILHSFEMTLDVQPTSISDNAIESKDEFTALENLVAEADQAVKDAETATEAANTAAGTANTAAGAANTAAGTANTAAQAANTAAGTANTAADNADDAADLANTAAGAANTAASAANTAAQEANDAADAANAAAGGDISNKTVTFTEAAEDTDIASGDTIATLFGKILKRFNTLKTTIQTILTNIGNLANLATTDKGSLVGAVNELNEDMALKPITDSAGLSGNTQCPLPGNLSGKNTIHIVTQVNRSSGTVVRQTFDLNFVSDLRDSIVSYFVAGGYANSDYNQYIEIAATRSYVRVNSFFVNGENVLNSAKTWVSYR